MGSNCALSDEEKDAIRNVLAKLKGREDQVDKQLQWLDEINVDLGSHTVFQKERLARIEAALALHVPFSADSGTCSQCALTLPCPTIKTLRGIED